jgi:hypothetical protein
LIIGLDLAPLVVDKELDLARIGLGFIDEFRV